MTLATLRQELKSRFGDFLGDTRANTLINEAYHSICEEEDWPFLETTATGTAPLTVNDVRRILSVVDTTNDRVIFPVDIRSLAEVDATLSTTFTPTTTGTATNYWLDGTTTLRVWPADTTSAFAVKYIKVPTDLALDADTPVLPSRYHSLIVDCAQARGLAQGPNPRESDLNRQQAIQLSYQQRLDRMRFTLLARTDGPDYIVPVVSEQA